MAAPETHNVYIPNSSMGLSLSGFQYKFAIPVIRQSVLNDFVACKRLFFLRHLLGLMPKVTTRSLACDVGTFFHAIHAATFVNGGDVGAAIVGASKTRDGILESISAAAVDAIDSTPEKQMALVNDAFDKAVVMARIFWDCYPFAKDIKVVSVEDTLTVQLDNTDGPYVQVKPDLIIQGLKNNEMWIEDHKTTGSNVNDAILGKSWSFQTRLYHYVVARTHGCPVGGFIFNIMQVPGIKLCGTDEKNAAKQGISPEEAYMIRVKEWYMEKVEDTIKSFSVRVAQKSEVPKEVRLVFNASLINPFAFQVDRDFPRDGSCASCKRWNRQCEFLGLCDSDPASWPHQIKMFFESALPEYKGEVPIITA